jgi:hypothetical protein
MNEWILEIIYICYPSVSLVRRKICRLATDSEVMLLCPASSSRAHGHDLGPKTASVAQVVMFLMWEHLEEHGLFY